MIFDGIRRWYIIVIFTFVTFITLTPRSFVELNLHVSDSTLQTKTGTDQLPQNVKIYTYHHTSYKPSKQHINPPIYAVTLHKSGSYKNEAILLSC